MFQNTSTVPVPPVRDNQFKTVPLHISGVEPYQITNRPCQYYATVVLCFYKLRMRSNIFVFLMLVKMHAILKHIYIQKEE